MKLSLLSAVCVTLGISACSFALTHAQEAQTHKITAQEVAEALADPSATITYFNVAYQLNPIDRVRQEGLFHPLIDAGALTHIWLGESRPDAESVANFVVKTFRQTQNSQIAFSPEFTACAACGRTTRGLLENCPHCGSGDIEGITRITGYFSRVPGWNKGKIAELRDRHRTKELPAA